MCKICKTEPGDITSIGEYEIKQMFGDKVVGRECLRLGYYINDDDNPKPYLVTDYVIHDERGCVEKGCIETPITYCPFCGRKLY